MGISTDMTDAAVWVGRKCGLLSTVREESDWRALLAELAARAAIKVADDIGRHEEWIAGLPSLDWESALFEKWPCVECGCTALRMAYAEPVSFGESLVTLGVAAQNSVMEFTCNRCGAKRSTKTASWKPYVAKKEE